MSIPQFPAIRRWVLTGSIAAVTATGALYGAGLKTKQELKQEQKTRLEATPTDQIEQLETYRAGLVQKKLQLDKKITELEAKKTRALKQQQQQSTSAGPENAK